MKRIPPNGPGQIRKIRADAARLAADIKYINTNRPDMVPSDAGPELVLVALCDRALAAAARGDGDEYARLTEELVAQAQRAAANFPAEVATGEHWPCTCVSRDGHGNPTHIKLHHPDVRRCSECGCPKPSEVRA